MVDNGDGTYDVTVEVDKNTLDGNFEPDTTSKTTLTEEEFKKHITDKGFSK